jgi:LCP family protein required for cell wall assembly
MAGPVHRTWPQRLVLTFTGLVTIGALVAAGIVWFANDKLGQVQRVEIVRATTSTAVPAVELSPGDDTATTFAVPSVDLEARNYLLVGSDSRECIDPNSPYAGAFLGSEDLGERSDTIMLLRIDPDTSQAAILSFPRDLWVRIGDSNRKSRINSAFSRDDPNILVRTIERNFEVPVHHYIEVNFCGFKELVDAIGGVKVPFEFPTRDEHTGLDIPAPGCYRMDGDQALAYVRSRHYEIDRGDGFEQDGTSDRGRIARQQDFIRRTLQRAIDRGATRPDIANRLLNAGLAHVKLDDQLKIGDLLALATKLRSFDPDTILSYRLDGRGTTIGGASVIEPELDNRDTQAILSVFRGEARLADAPDPDAIADVPDDPVATTSTLPAGTLPAGVDATAPAPVSTVAVDSNAVGVFPPDDPSCR